MATPLYLFTGFLGSGKTSVINSLLGHLSDKRIGLIFNDFGAIAVDSALVKGEGEISMTKSLSGGQIFCSCLSGSFVNAVEEMASLNLDGIIVEASGLAKPSPLLEIVSVIQQRTNHQISYSGMICVVDAERHLLLSQSLKTIEEQVIFSDWFIVNKSDLADETTLKEVKESIEGLRPLAPVFTTSFGAVDSELMNLLKSSENGVEVKQIDGQAYSGWGVHGRPRNCTFLPNYPFERGALEQFLATVSTQLLRMKGFIPTENGRAFVVDAVGPHVKVGEGEMPPNLEPGVMAIFAANVDALALIGDEWSKYSATPFSCIETP